MHSVLLGVGCTGAKAGDSTENEREGRLWRSRGFREEERLSLVSSITTWFLYEGQGQDSKGSGGEVIANLWDGKSVLWMASKSNRSLIYDYYFDLIDLHTVSLSDHRLNRKVPKPAVSQHLLRVLSLPQSTCWQDLPDEG